MLSALLLADTLPDPNSFASMGWLLAGITALVVAINQVLKITDRAKPSPPLHQQYATKEEVHAVELRFANGITELKNAIEKRDDRFSAAVVRIHQRIDDTTTEIIDLIKKDKQ